MLSLLLLRPVQLLLVTGLLFVHAMASATDFGTTGLVTVPTARMQADGTVTATIARNEVLDIFNLTFQAAPFIEGTFRYSISDPRDKVFSGEEYEDRSYEVKLRVLEEGDLRPAFAIGIRDIFGTGILAGEYLVASKTLAVLDLTVGLGWGRYAGKSSFSNPLTVLDNGFSTRPTGDYGLLGGTIRGETFFRGEAALFGGIRYRIPNSSFHLLAEYSSDVYEREQLIGVLRQPSPFSIGVTWDGLKGMSFGASYQRGQFLGLTLKTAASFKPRQKRIYEQFDSVADDLGQDQAPSFLDLDSWYDRLLFDAERSGLRLHSAHFSPGDDQVNFAVSNTSYALWADALNQFFTLSEIHLPKNFRRIGVAVLDDNLEGPLVSYNRLVSKSGGILDPIEQALDRKSLSNLVSVLPNRKLGRPNHETDFGYPKLAIGADLALRLQVMDPDAPLKHQLYLKNTGRVALSDSLNIWSVATIDISNDFDTRRPSDSVLPRVRSEINQYLTQGENGIDSLFGEYKESLSSSLHARFYVGLLEEMFGGVGGEVLYEPFATRWAVGANLNWVQQRAFDRRFRFQNYNVVTGHLSLFYASDWHNFDFGLHVGRYLAGDRGFTFEAKRTFDNGFALGAYFTRTNVSAEDFGEGSYDKGIAITIPYSLMLGKNTRGKYSTVLRTIERDGGRRLEGTVGLLWWNRRSVRFDALRDNRDRILP